MRHQFAPAGIDTDTAEQLSEFLQQRLLSLLDLGLTLKHVHWNVVGPGFIGVHEMLDEHVASVREMADEIAERIATLGGVPNGLPGHLTTHRSWDDYALGRGVVAAHLGALERVYDGITGGHREAMEKIEPMDLVSHDLLLGQTRTLEKFQWFVRAHIENTSGRLPTESEPTELGAAAAAAVADPLT
jgi:starvation-inducible DNA-binding protein